MHDLGLTHVALTITDLTRSLAFYERYAAMRPVHQRRDPLSGRRVAWIGDGTRPFVVVLIEAEAVEARLDGWAHLPFGCASWGVGCESRATVDRLCADARTRGCLVREPEDAGYPVGYWAMLRDPDGHHLELSFGQEVGLAVARQAGDVGPAC